MADIALVTANKINVVESLEQNTAPAGVAITAGQIVQIVGATGRWGLATTARAYGMATRTVRAGEGLTAIRVGLIEGFVVDGLAFDVDVFLNPVNGNLADAAGTPSVVVGRVFALYGNLLSKAHDKGILLEVRRAVFA